MVWPVRWYMMLAWYGYGMVRPVRGRGVVYGALVALLLQACAAVPEREVTALPDMPDAGPGKNAAVRVQRGLQDMEAGQYERAARYFSDALTYADLNVTERAVVLSNRGVAQQRLGLLDAAVADFSGALQLRSGRSGKGLPGKALLNRGITHFLRRDFALAVADLDAFVRQSATDSRSPYPVLWLYLARSQAGMDGRALLADGCRLAWRDEECNRRSGDWVRMAWPGPLFALHAEQIPPDDLLHKLPRAETGRQHQEQLCDAYFHLGAYHGLKGEQGMARHWWQMAVDTQMTHLSEHAAALAALQGGFFTGGSGFSAW
ncbi:MAG: hypothetical protein H7838_09100 [Magnetococcus sp. DMHC-8]